jgi:hypothetical protein
LQVEDTDYIVDKVLFVNLLNNWTETIGLAANDEPVDLTHVTKCDFETLHGVLSTKFVSVLVRDMYES